MATADPTLLSVAQRDRLWAAICDLGDPVTRELLEVLLDELTDHTPTRVLSSQEMLRLGALTVEQDQITALGKLLDAQEHTYRETLATQGPEPLIEGLLDRDTQLAHLGRQLADGKTAGRLLREAMRVVLVQSDHAQLKRIDTATKTGQVEQVLEALGAQPVDARQLKLHGSTLGALESVEQAAAKVEAQWAAAKRGEER